MTDNEQTERLRALLVQLRSARSVDTDIDKLSDWHPVDWVKDKFFVTHRTVAEKCTKLLKVCGQQSFRNDLRLLRAVLSRESLDKKTFDRYHQADANNYTWKSINVKVTALLWRRLVPQLDAYAKTLTVGTDQANALRELTMQIETYSRKENHKDNWNETQNDDATQRLLNTLPDLKDVPD
jgi:hypothetical protein